jgi:hypothetical protein
LIPPLGREGSAIRAAYEFAGGAQEAILNAASGMTTRESLVALPAFAVPYVGPGLALGLGAKALGAGAGQTVAGIELGEPRVAGAGVGESLIGVLMLAGGAKGALPEVRLPRSLEAVREEPPPTGEPTVPTSTPEQPTGGPNALHSEAETPIRPVQQPSGPSQGASAVPADVRGEETGARSSAVPGTEGGTEAAARPALPLTDAEQAAARAQLAEEVPAVQPVEAKPAITISTEGDSWIATGFKTQAEAEQWRQANMANPGRDSHLRMFKEALRNGQL